MIKSTGTRGLIRSGFPPSSIIADLMAAWSTCRHPGEILENPSRFEGISCSDLVPAFQQARADIFLIDLEIVHIPECLFQKYPNRKRSFSSGVDPSTFKDGRL